MTSKADRFAAQLGAESGKTQFRDAETKAAMHELGETAPLGMTFVQILAVSKYPYKYLPRGQGETVSIQFFSGGKFWDRDWEL